ncbi:DUF262 domain-containing protein [Pricia sp. S334]|uniref:DUF262 domain-containing protein n=1 Tax=Pricia mediterranea TaxID=3076079 RepID=A0ABU3L5C4_9FLAO|nr:DUF262 domain-containing protein [Pricia sp. S334]MDT7828862.1 DUF262 domain-containing protein [Pricia sp. S334]
MMAKSKLMQELSVDELMDELNFFIPEIQREYVWGHNVREILSVFCEDLIDAKESTSTNKNLGDRITELSKEGKFKEIKKLVESAETSNPLNIGFLYSYQPNYRMEHFPESDLYKDVYLIDGQQRLTTLFILLFYFSIKEKKKEKFLTLFRFNHSLESIAFDYRVRHLTHNFFIDFIYNVNILPDFDHISETTWFLSEYANDPTVIAVLKALEIIKLHFEGDDNNENYFDFLKNDIKFWHFKTEKTDQGEELYITMNSRGKQLEDNETLRAKLFEKTDKIEHLEWSERWEQWQDFFWRNRKLNADSNNADDGFNEFLRCIAALEAYKLGDQDFLNELEPIYSTRLVKYLSLGIIKRYFKSLEFLYKNRDLFKKQYEYALWVDKCFETINEIFFEQKTNWFIDYNNPNRATERRRMVLLWSIIDYTSSFSNRNIELDKIFRFLRVYWIRYNNFIRGVSNIKDRIAEEKKLGVWSTHISEDEKVKHKFFNKINNGEELRILESAIWKLEDHPLNLNGYQVQNINISHLVDFENKLNVSVINNIYDKFVSLFSHEKGSKKLNTILLYYGFYAMKRTPNYYDNWDFSSWRRIIRDIDSNEDTFHNFFEDYDGNNLAEIFEAKKIEFLTKNKETINAAKKEIECSDLLTCIKYYSLVVDDLWPKGRYIADSHYVPNKRLTTFEEWALFNTKGDFRGYGHKEFCFIMDQTHKNPIRYLKKLVKEL